MVGPAIHKIKTPSCDAIVAYMLAWGLDVDVSVEIIMHDNNLAMAGGGGIGVYSGRVNKNEGRKGTGYRLVPGHKPNTYRIIKIA